MKYFPYFSGRRAARLVPLSYLQWEDYGHGSSPYEHRPYHYERLDELVLLLQQGVEDYQTTAWRMEQWQQGLTSARWKK